MPVTDEDGYVWITAGDYDEAIRDGRAVEVPGTGFFWVPEFTPGILRGLRIVPGDKPDKKEN